MSELTKYGVAADFWFPLIKIGTLNYAVGADYSYASGDVQVVIDGVAGDIVTTPVVLVVGHRALWKFHLTIAEATGKKIQIMVGDAVSGQAVEDTTFTIETYGNASAQYQGDFSGADQTFPTNFATWGDLGAALTGATTEPVAVPASTATRMSKLDWMFLFFRNKQTMVLSTGAEKVFANDGSTVLGTRTNTDAAGTTTRGAAS